MGARTSPTPDDFRALRAVKVLHPFWVTERRCENCGKIFLPPIVAIGTGQGGYGISRRVTCSQRCASHLKGEKVWAGLQKAREDGTLSERQTRNRDMRAMAYAARKGISYTEALEHYRLLTPITPANKG